MKQDWHLKMADKIVNSKEYQDMRVAMGHSLKMVAQKQAEASEHFITLYLKKWLKKPEASPEELHDYIKRKKIRCGLCATGSMPRGSYLGYAMLNPLTGERRCCYITHEIIKTKDGIDLMTSHKELDELPEEVRRYLDNLPPIENLGVN